MPPPEAGFAAQSRVDEDPRPYGSDQPPGTPDIDGISTTAFGQPSTPAPSSTGEHLPYGGQQPFGQEGGFPGYGQAQSSSQEDESRRKLFIALGAGTVVLVILILVLILAL